MTQPRYRVALVGAGIGAQHVTGFNARPDLFELHIDRRPREGFAVAKNGLRPA